MFEDSTFETMGRIHTRSRGWMMATFAFNSSILLALMIIPILHPEMLPHITNAIPIDAPAPVPITQDPRPVVRTQQAPATPTDTPSSPIQAPRQNLITPGIPSAEPAPIGPVVLISDPSGMGSPDNPFGQGTHPDVRPALPVATQHISSGVMQGMLIDRVIPAYSAIAREARTSGTVVLQPPFRARGPLRICAW